MSRLLSSINKSTKNLEQEQKHTLNTIDVLLNSIQHPNEPDTTEKDLQTDENK